MKIAVVVILCGVLAYAAIERCYNAADCDYMKCSEEDELGCVQGSCTCTDPYAAIERCYNAADCDHVTCSEGHEHGCVQGLCGCTDPKQTCIAMRDCLGNCNGRRRCISGCCRCGFGIDFTGRVGK